MTKKRITISNSILDKIPMHEVMSRAGCYQEYIDKPSGQEHYRLLRYLGQVLKGSFIEIGTHCGTSALAMGYKTGTQVLTYDLVDVKIRDYRDIRNIEFKIADFFDDVMYHQDILKSDLIFIDASHDGELEKKIYQWLVKNEYSGVTIWDDIRLDANMDNFWNSSEIVHKQINLSKYGHITGTGCIMFTDQVDLELS